MATVRVDGADRLAQTLDAAGRRLDQLDHTEAGQIIADEAGRRAPRATGRLASSHTTQTTAGGVQVTNPVRYAIPQHQGWAGNAGRPWLATAAQATEARWIHTLEDEAQQVLDTVQGA